MDVRISEEKRKQILYIPVLRTLPAHETNNIHLHEIEQHAGPEQILVLPVVPLLLPPHGGLDQLDVEAQHLTTVGLQLKDPDGWDDAIVIRILCYVFVLQLNLEFHL